MVQSFYLCPGCGTDWSEIWDCACNSQCPRCGIKDIEPSIPDATLDKAFTIVLRLASNQDTRQVERDAIDLVTAYQLLNVKGKGI